MVKKKKTRILEWITVNFLILLYNTILWNQNYLQFKINLKHLSIIELRRIISPINKTVLHKFDYIVSSKTRT